MPSIGRNTKVTRLDKLTDDQIQARWAALVPTFSRWLLVAAGVTLGTFLFNHFAKPSQKVTDVANVVFQISAVFAFCFAVLTVASLYFRTGAWRTDRQPKKSS